MTTGESTWVVPPSFTILVVEATEIIRGTKIRISPRFKQICSPTPVTLHMLESSLHPCLNVFANGPFIERCISNFHFLSYTFVKGRSLKLRADLSIYRELPPSKLKTSHFRLAATQKHRS